MFFMSWLKKSTITKKTKSYYEIYLRWKGNPYIERIETNSYSAAIQAAKARFPGAYIGKAVRKKIIL